MKATRTFSVTARSWRLIALVLTGVALWSLPAEARNKKKKPAPGQPAAAEQQDTGKKSAPKPKNAQDEAAKPAVQPASPAAPSAPPARERPAAAPQKAPANPQAAQPPATGPPPVPGGGLAAHEKAGGHLITRHTGKTEAELIQRLRTDPQIVSCSSFSSLPVAEAVAGLLISRRQKEITAWLRSGDDRLALEITLNKPAGISVSRKTWKAEAARSVRLILQRDAGFPGGWRILTGYPQT